MVRFFVVTTASLTSTYRSIENATSRRREKLPSLVFPMAYDVILSKRKPVPRFSHAWLMESMLSSEEEDETEEEPLVVGFTIPSEGMEDRGDDEGVPEQELERQLFNVYYVSATRTTNGVFFSSTGKDRKKKSAVRKPKLPVLILFTANSGFT